MKIVIAHNYSDASFSAMSKQLANKLASLGHLVKFISHHPGFNEGFIDTNGVHVLGWPNSNPKSIKSFLFYWRVHREFNPDLIIAHFTAVNILSVVAWFCKTPKRVVYCHTVSEALNNGGNTFWAEMKAFRKDILYALASKVIIVSDYSRRDFRRVLFLGFPNLITINNGIPDRLRSEKLQIKSIQKEIRINYLGRLEKIKGIDLVVEYFIKNQVRYPNFVIYIAGAGPLADFFANLNNSCVQFLGKIDYANVDEYLRLGHFTLIPSLVDNLPTVCIESFMNGIPVIGNRGGGIPEMITPEVDGYLTNGLNEQTIMEVFDKVCQLSSTDYSNMCIEARKTFEKRFSMDVYLDNMLEKIINSD